MGGAERNPSFPANLNTILNATWYDSHIGRGADIPRFQGIASNYEGAEVISDRCSSFRCFLQSWPVAFCLAAPPCFFLLVAGCRRMQQYRNSARFRSRVALGRFEKIARHAAKFPAGGRAEYGQLLKAVRSYLGDRLMVRAGGFTCADFSFLLQSRGVDASLLDRLGQLWEICERERFGGVSATRMKWRDLVGEAVEIARKMDTQVG
jgi:hypothetical protein